MKPLSVLSILSLMTSLSLSLSVPALAGSLEQEVGRGRLDWGKGVLTVTGSGAVSGAAGQNIGQKRLMAQRAAISDAYRQLAEAVNGVQVFSESVVKDYVTESDVIRLQVQAVIRGAKQVGQPRYLSDGTVEVELNMPIFGRGSLAEGMEFGQALQNQLEQPFSSVEHYLAFRGQRLSGLSASSATGSTQLAQADSYTGLIIDAGGLAAEPAMGPFVVAGSKRLHVSQEIGVDPDRVVKEGPLHYVESLSEAKQDLERVGKNPLIIRAKAADGSPARSNILLDQSTAQKILEANKAAKFLENLKVTLVI